MADLRCAVCGEPYDAHGVRKDGQGDMFGWQADLFLKGAGCPSCEGEVDDRDPKAFETFSSALLCNGLDDYGHTTALATLPDKAPKWQKPPDALVWECAGCRVKVTKDADYGDLTATGGRQGNWDYRDEEDPDFQPRVVEGLDDKKFCHHCCTKCEDCSVPVLDDDVALKVDMVDSRAWQRPGKIRTSSLCETCYDKAVDDGRVEAFNEAVRNFDGFDSNQFPGATEEIQELCHQESDGSWYWPDKGKVREIMVKHGWQDPEEDADSEEGGGGS